MANRSDYVKGSGPITPADADLAKPTRSLYIGTGGTVKVTFLDGTVDTFTLPSQSQWPWAVKRVWLTGTGASDIHGLY